VSLMSGKLEIIQRGNSTLRCSSIIVCQSQETDKLLTCQSTHQTAGRGLWDWSMEEKKKSTVIPLCVTAWINQRSFIFFCALTPIWK